MLIKRLKMVKIDQKNEINQLFRSILNFLNKSGAELELINFVATMHIQMLNSKSKKSIKQ